MKQDFLTGARHAIPIFLGYLSVSFGFGILAVQNGLSPAVAAIISVTNLTSAGQAAGVVIMAQAGSLIEMAFTQLVINIRYALMSLSLSQKLDPRFTLPHRFAASYGITDEIFAMAASRPGLLTPAYLYGLIAVSFAGWVGGTVLGALAGSFLPGSVTDAMGLVLYAMFLAIIIPPARKDRAILLVILAAAGLSCVCAYLIPQLTSGFAVIVCAVAAAALGAFLHPIPDEEADA